MIPAAASRLLPGVQVEVGPSRPRKRDGFKAKVLRVEGEGEETVVHLVGGGTIGFRSVPIARVRKLIRAEGAIR